MPDAGPIPGAAIPSSSSQAFAIGPPRDRWSASSRSSSSRRGLADEPHFVDESAMISQSYFADLLLRGDRDNPAWLEYPGLRLVPAAQVPDRPVAAIRRLPQARARRRRGRWFRDTSSRFDPPGALVLARWPFAIGGALGCVAIYALGTLARDRKTGLLAAFLLMINPLYRMHARRAMADVLVEAFLFSCLALVALGLASAARGPGRRRVVDRGGPGGRLRGPVGAGQAQRLARPGDRRRVGGAGAGRAGFPDPATARVRAAGDRRDGRRGRDVRGAQSVPDGAAGGAAAPHLDAIAGMGFWSRAGCWSTHRTEAAREQVACSRTMR